MNYCSTNNRNTHISFQDAMIRVIPPDGGLYVPCEIPTLDPDWISTIPDLDIPEVAYRILSPYLEKEIPEPDLRSITGDALNFPIPVHELEGGVSALELFHGPSWAFKDVGARFLSRCVSYFLKGSGKTASVLVATAGDTGGAVAGAFHAVDGVRVNILFPRDRISGLQKLQITRWGDNVRAFEVEGAYDDCQILVNEAFRDPALKSLDLLSANSINLGRLLPQVVYYFLILKGVAPGSRPIISIPSGNFGNLAAGLIAMKMGLPVDRWVAACNANTLGSEFLEKGRFTPRRSIATYANAMDVGNPSNISRIKYLFNGDHEEIRRRITSHSLSDPEILQTITDCHQNTRYVLDPHGACGYAALKANLKGDEQGVFLATAHPVKFADTVRKAIEPAPAYPQLLSTLKGKTGTSIPLRNDYKEFKKLLLAEN